MVRKITTVLTLIAFTFTLPGCVSSNSVPLAELKKDEVPTIHKLVTTDGKEIQVVGARVVGDTILIGTTFMGRNFTYPFSKIQTVYVSSMNWGLTVVAIFGIPVLIALVIAATKKSCPFIYSYDGLQYHFDGEPYGGAICEGLKRTDWSRLSHIRPSDNTYKVLLTNEMDETQYTDELKLRIVDHQQGTTVVLDADGNIYAYTTSVSPLAAFDQHARDISLWIKHTDDLFWQSDIDSKNAADPADARDTVYLSFPRKDGSSSATLLASVSTTVWGSQMLKRMTEIRGEKIPDWFSQLRSPLIRGMVDEWDKREELYHLQVKVRTATGWEIRGYILGGGPFKTETRAIPIDLSGVTGDTMHVQLTPPAGFWQMNSFALTYDHLPSPPSIEVAASSAIADDETDVRSLLDSTDNQYYAVPAIGQYAHVTFPVPPMGNDVERTVFAKTSGWYDVHMTMTGPAQMQLVNRISFEPGYPALYGLQEYFKWKAERIRAMRPMGEAR